MDFISSLLVGLAQLLCESMNMAERRGDKTDLRQAITDLETAAGDLKATRDDLNLQIQQDDLNGRSCSNRAREWLSVVQALEAKTDSILARFRRREQRTRMRRRCLGCFGCADYKLCKKVFATLKSINELGERYEAIKTDGGSIQKTKFYKKNRFTNYSDDVWEEIDFERTGVPRPDRGNKCKVMFTTRSMALCSKMGAECKLRVEFLRKQYAWELFCDKVGRKDLLESPSIRPLAEVIVNKCGGLPIALITLGETEEEWIHACEVLNRFPAEMKGMNYVFALLKLSYDNLESDLLRSCFLYCALFPEEHSIEIEQLVEYWVGEGFLSSAYGVNTIYKGYFLIADLKAACLLETGDEKTQVKMHNVVRSFALWMASEQGTYKELILIEPSMGLTEANDVYLRKE